MIRTASWFLPALAILCVGASVRAATPQALDRGPLDATAATTPIAITIALALPALEDAEKLEQAIYTPGDPDFHHFLTAEEFVTRFAPSEAEIANVVGALAKYRLSAEKTTATTLRVTGRPADMERAFSVRLHSYEVAPHDGTRGYAFHAPLSRPMIPAEITVPVAAIVGLDSRPAFRPLSRRAPAAYALCHRVRHRQPVIHSVP